MWGLPLPGDQGRSDGIFPHLAKRHRLYGGAFFGIRTGLTNFRPFNNFGHMLRKCFRKISYPPLGWIKAALVWSFGFIQPKTGWVLAKRLSDAMEKLGVAGLAITFFGQNEEGLLVGTSLLFASFLMTALIARYD